jgi:hypothetical protein
MIHPGLAALEKWEPIEYPAGYRARLAAIPDSEIAHHCWRCGWEDADTEALELERHKRVLAEGREDDYAETWGLLFGAGGDARANRSLCDGQRASVCVVLRPAVLFQEKPVSTPIAVSAMTTRTEFGAMLKRSIARS